MTQVAIILNPGQNTEIESLRELKAVGLDAKIFRWNEDPSIIRNVDSFLIPGGFSYEDRGRSGLISAKNPIMQTVIEEADKGKPVLGICNGAQGLVETKLVPGDTDRSLALALAKNKRIKDGEILGTGYYNTWVYIKRAVDPLRTPYTKFVSDKPYAVPVAHGEGRYSTIYPGLEQKLQENEQVVFQYCDKDGNINPEFPTNPNGALLNAASICNPMGNVVSIMPHPERGRGPCALPEMFASLKDYLENKPKLHSFPAYSLEKPNTKLEQYLKSNPELIIEEIITDNECYTIENTLKKVLNNPNLSLKRYTHFEINQEISSEIHDSGELYNSNKQTEVSTPTKKSLLVRYREDFEGQSIASNLAHHYNLNGIEIKKGTLWTFENMTDEEIKKAIETNLFFNPNSQIAYDYI